MSFSVGDDRTAAGFGSPTGPGGGVATGDVIAGRFRLQELLGEGGMGVVWAVEDATLSEVVALKLVRPELLVREGATERFLREVRVLRSLQHPGIVRILDVVSDPALGLLGYTMERLEGRSLRVILQNYGKGLPMGLGQRIFSELLEAVGALHLAGVVHRDLKPENIFVTKERVKVLDFGLAKTEATTALTLTGAGLGSVTYVAPEQKRDGGSADERSDIFSLGVILHELFTGEPPEGHFDPAHVIRPGVPERLHGALLGAIHKRPERRFGTVADFSEAWEGVWSPMELEAVSTVVGPKVAPSEVAAADSEAPVTFDRPDEPSQDVEVPASAEMSGALTTPVSATSRGSPSRAGSRGRFVVVALVLLLAACAGLLVDGMPLDFVGRSPQIVKLKSPRLDSNGRVVLPNGKLEITGVADPWARVQVRLTGASLSPMVIHKRGAGRFLYESSLEAGRHELQFLAVYPEGEELERLFGPKHWIGRIFPHRHVLPGAPPRPAHLVVVVDDGDPLLKIAPLPRLTSAASVKLQGEVTDSLTRPLLTIDGSIIAPSSNGEFFWPWALGEGRNSVEVVARDEAGHTVSQTVSVIRDSVSPVIRAPRAGETLRTGADGVFEVVAEDESDLFLDTSHGHVLKTGVGHWMVRLEDRSTIQTVSLRIQDSAANFASIVVHASTPEVEAQKAAKAARAVKLNKARVNAENAQRRKMEAVTALADREVWAKSSKAIQDYAIRLVERQLGSGYVLIGAKRFSCGGRSHRIAVFRHQATGILMNLVPGGTFRMGAGDGEPDEKPVHAVKISPCLVGQTEVAQASWDKLKGVDERRWRSPNLPIERCSWEDVNDWLRRAGSGLRLPSEAEWEYVCRAGTTGAGCFGDSLRDLGAFAWYEANSGSKSHPVGEKRPNAFGLFDVHGNVYEWCLDTWHSSYSGAPSTGQAWVDEGGRKKRVVRGGSWSNGAGLLRTAFRTTYKPASRFSSVGFRVFRGLRFD